MSWSRQVGGVQELGGRLRSLGPERINRASARADRSGCRAPARSRWRPPTRGAVAAKSSGAWNPLANEPRRGPSRARRRTSRPRGPPAGRTRRRAASRRAPTGRSPAGAPSSRAASGRRAERPRHGHERPVDVAHGAHHEHHDREEPVDGAVEDRRRRPVAEQEDDPGQHQDLRDAVERDHVGGEHVPQQAHRADGEAGRDAERDRQHVGEGRLGEGVGQRSQRRAADPAERPGDGGGRRNEERVDPAAARRGLPDGDARRTVTS